VRSDRRLPDTPDARQVVEHDLAHVMAHVMAHVGSTADVVGERPEVGDE
jgi:hypothetical protein